MVYPLFIKVFVIPARKIPPTVALPVIGRYAKGKTVIFQQVDIAPLYWHKVGFKIGENITVGKAAGNRLQGRANKLNGRMLV